MGPGPVLGAEPGMGPGPALGADLAVLVGPGTGAAADSVAVGVA